MQMLQQNREYIAIELKAKRLHVRWNVGGRVLRNELKLEYFVNNAFGNWKIGHSSNSFKNISSPWTLNLNELKCTAFRRLL